MKILYVIESLTSGGKERRLISLIKELLMKDNVEIQIIILSDDIHYEEIYQLDVKIHLLKRNFIKDIRIFSRFNGILNNFQPDIVHCWDNIAAIHFGPICKIKRIPFINSMISTAPPLLSLFSKKYFFNSISYPFSDIILTNSKAGLRSFRVPENKGRFIYNGIDFGRKNIKVSEDQIRKMFNVSTKYVVGMTAGFYDRKDYRTFVEAGKLVLKNRKDVTFIAIGDGPNLYEIKTNLGDQYQPYYRFVGKQIDVESIVNIFDIGVLATYTEGISNAIMEYMMLEKPVIATDGGGTNELVIHNENGYLIEQQNIEELTDRINYLLEHSEKLQGMGKKGKERLKKHFSIEKMIIQTWKLYEDCLN